MNIQDKEEIERKFLLSDDSCLRYGTKLLGEYEIEQTYLSINPEIRLRKIDELWHGQIINTKYYHTVKGDGTKKRKEFEFELSREQYSSLVKNSNIFIKKTRYMVVEMRYGNHPYELSETIIFIDVFHEELEGLYVAEVEFNTEKEADAFVPPDWFGEELTEKKEYKGKNIFKRLLDGNAVIENGKLSETKKDDSINGQEELRNWMGEFK